LENCPNSKKTYCGLCSNKSEGKHDHSNELIVSIISEKKNLWDTLKREIETKHANAAKVMEEYKEIIELAEGQPINLALNRKSLKDESEQLKDFKREFDRTFAEKIQPKMSDLRIIEEQKEF
jgi:hypothetical protein